MSPRFLAPLACLVLALQAAPPEAKLPPKVLRADLTELFTRLQASHADLYARRDKAAYDRLFEQMRKDFRKPLTRAQARDAFQRFMAYGRVAHARLEEPDAAAERFWKEGGKGFPLDLKLLQGRAFVSANLSGVAGIAPGDELLSVEGQPMGKVLAAFGRFISADTDTLLHAQAENDTIRLLWKHFGPLKAFRVTLRRADGTRHAQSIPARSAAERRAAAKGLPKALDLDWLAREAKVLPGGVAYLRPGLFMNLSERPEEQLDTKAFLAFLDGAFERFLKEGATRLLIDLRNNFGGDSSFSDPMVAWFATKPFCFTSDFRVKVSDETTASNAARLPHLPPGSICHQYAVAYAQRKPGEVFSFPMATTQPRKGRRFQGKVFMLVNRHSYSNAANVPALAQDHGFATILGEETADLATTYGAMEHFTLSRTGFKVGYPKAHIIRPSGERTPRGVVPNIAILTPAVEGPEDPVLQKALEIVRK